jgi:ATP-dependent Lon protease
LILIAWANLSSFLAWAACSPGACERLSGQGRSPQSIGLARERRRDGRADSTEEQCKIADDVLLAIIRDYTREAGVRNLERQIGAICRHAAMRIAEGNATHITIAVADLQAILGPKRFEQEIAMRTSVPGVATGLAWTPVGGDILFVEATSIPGRGKLILTGQLGEVMKESAQAALTLVKSRAAEYGIDTAELQKSDVHIHVPAGAIPKDGPSAGVAMFMALTSLLTARRIRSDTAMTGEISLRGLVLPIGGVKEKVLAAIQAGITTVMLPARNRRDLEDVPEKARNRIRFVWLERVDDAIDAALNPPQTRELGVSRTSPTAPPDRQVARSR